ncbi:hypothetical protein IAT38_007904 [Cryptococcus sp. DSM 104549]
MRLTSPPRAAFPTYLILPIPLVGLLITYLWAIARRPSVPEHAMIRNPHAWGFPKWYSKGESPYDAEEGEANEWCPHPKRVLLFIDDSSQISSALTTLNSLQSDNTVNVTYITPFSPTWDRRRTAQENLEAVGCGEMDRIWRIGGMSGDVGGCGKVLWISDGFDGVDKRADVVLRTHPQELLSPELSHKELGNLGLISHVLPAAEWVHYISIPLVFYPARAASISKSVTYFPSPATPSRSYPRLPWGRGWSIYPASRSPPPPTRAGQDPLDRKSKYRKYWEKDEKRRAKTMRKAGICLFEGWQDGLLDERMAQALLSGCIVATVPPQSAHDVLDPIILPLPVPVAADGSPLPLPVSVLDPLRRETSTQELKIRALKGFIAARHRLVPRSRTKSVWEAVKRSEEGGRGYEFPHGFRWDCSSAVKPPWC